jgi:hypothetical protein
VSGWQASERWAFDLRARHYLERPDAEPQEEFLRWQGSQRGAVLLAVLHLLATRLDGPVHARELRRWLGRGEELDIGGLILRVTAHLAELTATTGADDPDLVLLSGIWHTLVAAEPGPGALWVRPSIVIAAVHGRWLLDAQLAAERGGLPPHTLVTLRAKPGGSTHAKVHAAYWMDDDGPPVGYVLILADDDVVSVRPEMVGVPADCHCDAAVPDPSPGSTTATPATPGNTTAAPGSTTATPGSTTATPGSTTATPGSTTATPGSTTATPGSTTATPGSTTATPATPGSTAHAGPNRGAGRPAGIPSIAARVLRWLPVDGWWLR